MLRDSSFQKFEVLLLTGASALRYAESISQLAPMSRRSTISAERCTLIMC